MSYRLLVLFTFLLTFANSAAGRILQVGQGKEFSVPSKAATVARSGDIVEISAGTYTGDVAVWDTNNLVLRGVGGRPHLKAGGVNAQGKAIWVIRGENVTVENIELSGAKVPDANGAGIRHEGTGLTIRNCYIHDNEVGILTGTNPNNDILIEYSEFANSYGDYNHNIYIGKIRKFTLQFSYIHHATNGHNVKTRAQNNFILYNRIMDELEGRSSFAIDLPNGGRSYIIGNVIQKGVNAENSSVISYAAEGATNPLQEFYLVNNTIVSDFRKGTFLKFFAQPDVAKIVNNIFAGIGVRFDDAGDTHHNIVSGDVLFRDRRTFDYRVTNYSPAIDAGTAPGIAEGHDLTPVFQYVHPSSQTMRTIVGQMDIGAYEFGMPARTDSKTK